MASRPHAARSSSSKSESLMVRVDRSGKQAIVRAARLRGVSASDYVRSTVISQARREIDEARTRTIMLDPGDQLAFWEALQAPVSLTARQRALGRLMRGER